MLTSDIDTASGRFRAESPWRPWLACVATIVVVAISLVLPVAATVLALGAELETADPDVTAFSVWGPLLMSQALMAAGAVWLAGWFKGRRANVLSLAPPYPALIPVVVWFLMIGAVSLTYTVLVYLWRPEIVRADIASFTPLIRSSAWPAYALVIAVGAPLSEELLFRGFLQSALAKSWLGYIGASVVTTVSWTLLHIQYSIFGLAEIFVVGLFLCWVLWRTGSLWAAIIIHGLFNGIQFVGTRLGWFPWS